jgi:hypothetical protein
MAAPLSCLPAFNYHSNSTCIRVLQGKGIPNLQNKIKSGARTKKNSEAKHAINPFLMG